MIDDIDSEILRELQIDARISNTELGRRVGLSPNAAGARVARLVERGLIRRFAAVIDQAALGRPMEAIVDCWLRQPDERDGITRLARTDDRIVEAIHITGSVDFRLRTFVASATDLDDLLTELRREAGVNQTETHLVLHRIELGRDRDESASGTATPTT